MKRDDEGVRMKKAGKLPGLFFLAVWAALFGMSGFLGQTQVFYWIEALSLYAAGVLLLMVAFGFLESGTLRTPAALTRLLEKKKKFSSPAALLRRKKKTGADAEGLETEEDGSAGTLASAGSEAGEEKAAGGFQEIRQEKKALPTEEEQGKKERRRLLLQGTYVLLQGVFAFLLVRTLFPGDMEALAENWSTEYAYLHVVVLLLLTGAAFVGKKLLSAEGAGERRGSVTACGLCAFFGILCALSAAFLAVRIMFSLDYLNILFWILRLAPLYVAAMVLIGVVWSLVKETGERSYNYFLYIPFVNTGGKAGEGFLDILEKNTGLSFKSLWSIRYILSIVPGLLLAMLLLLLLATSVYKIEPYQEGAVYRLGTLTEDSIAAPGFHVKLPWPLETLEVYDVKREQSLQIGYEATESNDFLWTRSHGGVEYTLLLGNGNELIAVNLRLTYVISDLYDYLCNHKEPTELLSAAAYEIMMDRTVSSTLDNVLSVDRSTLAESVKKELQTFSEEMELGIQVNNVNIQSLHPPVDVADTYQGVVGAGIEKQSLITTAEARANAVLADAQRESEHAVIAAQVARTERLAQARYEQLVFEAAYEAYTENPQSFKLTRYLNMYERVMNGKKVYVFAPNVDMDFSKYIIDQGTAAGTTDSPAVEMTTIE